MLYRDSIGWWIVLNFLVYVTLPVRLRYTGILLGMGSFASYIIIIIGLNKQHSYFIQQVRTFEHTKTIYKYTNTICVRKYAYRNQDRGNHMYSTLVYGVTHTREYCKYIFAEHHYLCEHFERFRFHLIYEKV